MVFLFASMVILRPFDLKAATLTTLSHGASFHLAHLTTAQVKDVISASKRNF